MYTMKKNKIVVVFSSHLGKAENDKFIWHIKKTIGKIEHEVICYENYNQYSLTEVYNKALNKYKENNTIILFVHPDIIIKTRDWGKLLLNKFNNNHYDILGVAGSTYIPDNGIWWSDRNKMHGIVEHTDGSSTWISEYSSEKKGHITETVSIDGLFMAVNPNTIIHQFDEDFLGFHFYDLSFCIPNYLDGCNIGVTTDLRILHKSVGMTNEQWEFNRNKFIDKYYMDLPVSILPIFNDFNLMLENNPKVTVIIPTKNNFKYISNNIQSWKNVVKYSNYEIIMADTGSDESVIEQYNSFLCSRIKLIKYDYYNFAKINNDVVKNHVSEDTELILFCNDDVTLLNDALSRCVEIYNEHKNKIGTIGIRLHYGDSSIQHCGISIRRNKTNNLILSHIDLRKTINYCTTVKNTLGNTAAFLLINKNLFIETGYFNENYIECLEDVELNLECLLRDRINITVCDAVAYHYESVSRNKDNEKNRKFQIDYTNNLLPYYLLNINKLKSHIHEE